MPFNVDLSLTQIVPVLGSEGNAIEEVRNVDSWREALTTETTRAHAELIHKGAKLDGWSGKERIWKKTASNLLDSAEALKAEGRTAELDDVLTQYFFATEFVGIEADKVGYGHPNGSKVKPPMIGQLVKRGMTDDMQRAFSAHGHLVVIETHEKVPHEFASTLEAVTPMVDIIARRTTDEGVREHIATLSFDQLADTASGLSMSSKYTSEEKHILITDLTRRALGKLTGEYTVAETDIMTEKLIQLAEANPHLLDDETYKQEFIKIQNKRKVHTRYRVNDQSVYPIDQSIIFLWKNGHEDIAKRLLTASSHEMRKGLFDTTKQSGNLEYTVASLVSQSEITQEDADRVTAEISNEIIIRSQKLTEYMRGFLGNPETRSGMQLELMQYITATQNPEYTAEIVEQMVAGSSVAEVYGFLHEVRAVLRPGEDESIFTYLTGKFNAVTNTRDLHSIVDNVSKLRGQSQLSLIRDTDILEKGSQGDMQRLFVSELAGIYELNIDTVNNAISTLLNERSSIPFSETVDLMYGRLQNLKNSGLLTSVSSSPPLLLAAEKVIAQALTEEHPVLSAEEFTQKLEILKQSPLMDRYQQLLRLTAVGDIVGKKIFDIAQSGNMESQIEGEVQMLDTVLNHPLMNVIAARQDFSRIASQVLAKVITDPNPSALCDRALMLMEGAQDTWKTLYGFTEMLVGMHVDSDLIHDQFPVMTVPLVIFERGALTKDANFNTIKGFKPKLFSSYTVDQKRSIVSNGESMDDAQLDSMRTIQFDLLKPEYKRAVYAYQLYETIHQSQDTEHKIAADERNRSHTGYGNNIKVGDYIHGAPVDVLGNILKNGNIPGESRELQSKTDAFPFNVDMSRIPYGDTIEASLEQTRTYAGGYGSGGAFGPDGQMALLYKRGYGSWMHGQETQGSDVGHPLIFGGVPSTEISGIILTNPDSALSLTTQAIVKNDFYIPVYDRSNNLLFSPVDYDDLREKAIQEKAEQRASLSSEGYNPGTFMAYLKRSDEELKTLFESNSGTEDGTTETNTIKVMQIFETYYAKEWDSPLLSKEGVRIMLALHDVGTARAYALENSRANQHKYTMEIIPDVLETFEIKQPEREVIAGIVDQDFMGEFFQGRIPIAEAAAGLRTLMADLHTQPEAFFDLMKMFYTCDAGSYEALGAVFNFDHTNNNVEFSERNQKMYDELHSLTMSVST